MNGESYEEEEEKTVVASANAIGNPWAVMIEGLSKRKFVTILSME